jgi:hypothetical protein
MFSNSEIGRAYETWIDGTSFEERTPWPEDKGKILTNEEGFVNMKRETLTQELRRREEVRRRKFHVMKAMHGEVKAL